MTELAHFWIVSPMMEEVEPVLEDGSGPLVQFADAVCVEARTKREAKVLGVKLMEHWPTYARRDDRNPFSGVKAESALCPHGLCHCDIEGCSNYPENDLCPECREEHDREFEKLMEDRSLMDDPE